jgi:hypothetical protein
MVDLHLATLTVVKKADNIGKDEPMLWTLFVEVSLATIASRQFVVTTDPLKGKLAKAGKNDTVNIPTSVGRFQRGAGVFFTGVAALAFDNDLRTNTQIKNGYTAGAQALNQAIIDHFPKYGVTQIGDAEQAEINAKVRQAILDAFLEGGVVRTLLGGKPLGGATFTRMLTEPSLDEPVELTFRAKKDRAIYRVEGTFKFVK